VAYALAWIPRSFHVVFVGYMWGLFLIVDISSLLSPDIEVNALALEDCIKESL